ncbi:ComEC/Rec2 family competence protein [Ruthenibacterium lactatiformans]|uniref:ComEC/Rec2 family competence protein n=1 Tax=Ruthenibacterium lactatiformans TaxID=1550024 RepID=UPI00186899E7|nr:ComEC/Rec2 family competence protein [Ruthenibacterium lactatiformans]
MGGRFRTHAVLACTVTGAALLLRMSAFTWMMAPIQARAGTQAEIHAAVVETSPGFPEDTVRAGVLVDEVNGMAVRPFRVYFISLPQALPGECFSARVEFAELEENEYTYGNYADGIFLAGEYLDGFLPQGESGALWARAKRVQAALSMALRKVLAQPYAGAAAAMTAGDRALLTDEVKDAFRGAGLSHVLVVSGLHLSAVGGLVYAAVRRMGRRRLACACAMFSSLAFMCLTGFTPSVVRAGTAMLLLYGGALFNRKSDALTSLGLAALLLCLQNPYAAVDVSLLLSFSATLGVLWVTAAHRRWRAGSAAQGKNAARLVWKLLWTAAVPAATSLTTLPVLIAIGGGVSLLSVVSNLLAVPVMPAVVGLGFAAALCSGVPWLGFLAKLTGLGCALLLRWMLAVAEWTASVPYAFLHVSGAFAMCAALLLCALGWAAWRLHVPVRRAVPACLAFVMLSGLAYAAADSGVVRMELAGSAANPPLVVMQGLKTAVLFRGPEANADDVREVLEQYNRTQVDLLVDLRMEGDTAALAQKLHAQDALSAQNSIINSTILAPFHDIIIYVKHQAKGNFACVEVCGYRVGIASGSVEFSSYPPFDIYVAGTGRPDGLACTHLILPRTGYRWLEDAPRAQFHGPADICLRAGASVTIKEGNKWF